MDWNCYNYKLPKPGVHTYLWLSKTNEDFTPSMTKALPQLEYLELRACDNLVAIVSSDIEEDAVAC